MASAEEDPGDDHDLSGFFKEWEGKSGIYFISPYLVEDLPDNMYPVKVGMSRHRLGNPADPNPNRRRPYGGLGRRLDSYLLCFPYGFYVYAVLQCPREAVYQVESTFHQYLTSKSRGMAQTHSHREEWFHLTRDEVYSMIRTFMRTYPGRITSLEAFGGDQEGSVPMPRFVDTNGRLAANPKKPMMEADKLAMQLNASPGGVLQTLPRKVRRPNDDEKEVLGAPPKFSLNEE